MSNENPTPLALPAGVDRVADLGTLLTMQQTAEKLGVSNKTIRRMIDRGELLGAHMEPMPTGRGTRWVIPYAEVVAYETKTPAKPVHHFESAELGALRETIYRLEAENTLNKALADERGHQLEQLHTTFRLMLTAGENSKKRWWKKP